MRPTPENKELVAAECLRLRSIGFVSDEALEMYLKIFLRHYPSPESVSEAITYFAETSDTVPPPVAFVRYNAASAAKVPTRAYCRVCEGTGFEMRQEMRHASDTRRLARGGHRVFLPVSGC